MAYVYSNDPRLKRHASASPDAPPNPKRPATLAVRELSPAVASNHTNAHSNGVVSTAAPVAEMTRKVQNAPIVELKMQINLQTITMMNWQLKLEHAETQVRTAEADYQIHASKNHFTAYPALKETKTTAVDRAKRALRAAREPLDSARSELQRLIESLVDLEQSRQSSAQDAISRAEFEELRRDINGVREDISAIRQDLSNARGTVDVCKADQETTTKTLEDLRRTINSNAVQTNGTPAELPAQLDPDTARRLEEVESDVKDLYTVIENGNKTVSEWVLEELKAPRDALVELTNGLRNTETSIAELHGEVKRVDEESVQLRDALTKGVEDQHTNAGTLQGCLDRLDRMEPLLDQATDQGALNALKNSFQELSNDVESVKTAQRETSNAAQQRPTNGVSSGLASFQPIVGGDDQDDISPFKSRPIVHGTLRKFDDTDLTTMKGEIEALKYKVQDQTNRYNNLQTDQLAQNILDNLGAVYPNLKEAERVTKTVHELQGRFGALEATFNDISARTGAIASRVDTLDSNVMAGDHASEKDMRKLRDDIAGLSGKVDQQAKDIEAGRQQFLGHNSAIQDHTVAIEKVQDDLRGVETWIENRE